MTAYPRDACKDCGSTTRSILFYTSLPRKKGFPDLVGLRCMTCWRERRKERKKRRHEAHVQKTYGLAEGEYDKLYEMQGGKCAICLRANGSSKRLAVDHDHRDGRPRGLLCGPCNSNLGHARDEIDYFHRAAAYLISPPYDRLQFEAEKADYLKET